MIAYLKYFSTLPSVLGIQASLETKAIGRNFEYSYVPMNFDNINYYRLCNQLQSLCFYNNMVHVRLVISSQWEHGVTVTSNV